MSISLSDITQAAVEALLQASTAFSPDQKAAYERALAAETDKNSRWIMEMVLENALVAEKNKLPLCDDTGIPHVLLEIGHEAQIRGNPCSLLEAVEDGIARGLRALPGRPMAVQGDDLERISQTKGLSADPAMVLPAPVRITKARGKQVRLHVLMLGGGPEIRSRTFRIFHHHDHSCLSREIIHWAGEMASKLGCTPCVPAVGIGRSHYEAACLAMEAMIFKGFGQEDDLEKSITEALNKTGCGALGLGGKITALNTFVKVGPQRASGVRITSLRLGCCYDPRKSTITLE